MTGWEAVAGTVISLSSYVAGVLVGVDYQKCKADLKPSHIDTLDLTKSHTYSLEESRQIFYDPTARERIDAEKEYAVTGTPRHIPWSRRKKELEASARQKRRQLESFREQA